MKNIIFSIGLFLLFACQHTVSKKSTDLKDLVQLKIAAYNVEYSKNATAEEIGEALNPYDFDVVCFSEAPGGDWTKKAGEIMGLNHVVVGKYSTAGHVDKYKTIASKTSLFNVEEILMADTLHSVTKAKTKVNDVEFAIYAVHFPFGWRDQAHIDETTNKISTFANYLYARQKDEISVIAGDFNFIPSNASKKSMYHEMFKGFGLDISWVELGIDCTKENTFDALKPEDQGSGEVIDHIMYNPAKMKALKGEIIELEKPLSDHKPVWTLLQLKQVKQ